MADNNFADDNNYPFQIKEDLNLIQMLESFSSGRRCVNRLRSEPPQRRFWILDFGKEMPGGTTYRHAALTIVLDIATTTFEIASKSYRGLGLRMPTG